MAPVVWLKKLFGMTGVGPSAPGRDLEVVRVLAEISHEEWIYRMGPAGQSELDRLGAVTASLSHGEVDLLENLRCICDLYQVIHIEPREGFFPPGRGSSNSSHFSLHMDQGSLSRLLSGALPTIRSVKNAHHGFSLRECLQIPLDATDTSRVEDRLWLGKANYYEASAAYLARVEEYCAYQGWDIEELKQVPHEEYQASREVYEVYLENLRPRREYYLVYGKVAPP
jgi:hypothetical protein